MARTIPDAALGRRIPAVDKTTPLARLFDEAMTRIDPADEAGRLYDRFADGLYRYALAILADRDGAADVIQQVFTAVLAKGRRITSDERYLRRAVRNECFTHLRLRAKRVALGGASDDSILEAAAPGVDPAERMAIEDAVRALPPDQREVVHLKVWEGMTFQEIADVTGESINTVASRYRYAVDKIRSRLAPASER